MSVNFNGEKKIFTIETDNMTYAMHITDSGSLIQLYYGCRMPRVDDLPTVDRLTRRFTHNDLPLPESFSEYPAWGETVGNACKEPAVTVDFYDGTRSAFLRYESHAIDGEELAVTLSDRKYGLECTLKYRAVPDCDIIERSAVILNRSEHPFKAGCIRSAAVNLPYREHYRLTSLSGKCFEEFRIVRRSLEFGQTVLQTRNGMSGPDHAPVYMIDEGDASQGKGGVYFGTLVWSGNHKIIAERDAFGTVQVTAGVSDFDFSVTLEKGESFETPVLAIGFTEEGFGGASHCLHEYTRSRIMHPSERDRIMPVVCNLYGTYLCNINEQVIMDAIEPAYRLGVEALIVDGGWAGQGDDYALGMGEWNINPQRFPHGLRPIADELHRRGMMFGLWMEPECIHPDSPVLKEHPDWAFGYPGRGIDVSGVRCIVNFALDEVRDYFTEKIASVITDCKVDYLKIDFNRRILEMGTPRDDEFRARGVWVKYVDNLTAMFMELKRRFPQLLIENCASGGQRADLNMLRFSGRMNRSDNQDPLDILTLHEGFSAFLPPKLAGGGCHISDVYTSHINGRRSTMRYQAHCAMMGSLAIGKNLVTMTDAEAEELRGYVELYKSIRGTVQLGRQYVLASASDHPYAAYEYVARDGGEAVLFLLGKSNQFAHIYEPLRLDGLCPDALYHVEECAPFESEENRISKGVCVDPHDMGVYSGRALMRLGLQFTLTGDMSSKVLRISRVADAAD
jgi:alpha-galactosidase